MSPPATPDSGAKKKMSGAEIFGLCLGAGLGIYLLFMFLGMAIDAFFPAFRHYRNEIFLLVAMILIAVGVMKAGGAPH